MLCKMYSNVSECLRRLGTQLKVLLDILSGFDDTREASSATDVPGTGLKRISLDKTSARERSVSPVAPPSNRMLEILDTSHLLAQAVELVQGQIIKVVRVRSEQTARLPLLELIRYVNLNKLFATECEAISGNSSTALNALVNSQIKDFITNFSDSQLRRLVQAMDSDRWDARDFGDDEQQCLSHILAAEADDPPSWRSDSQAEEGQSEPSQTVGEPSPPLRPRSLSTATSASQSVGKEKVRTANIGAAKYILPGCAIAMLSVLEEYLHLIAEMPSMAVEISPRLLECLRLFNSRSSQLILGAGATRSAGLKNITTKHLALASQALSFIVALVPAIQTFLARHAGAAAQTGEFDKVKRLYQDHQTGIHEKLVEIMSSRAAVHVAAMKKIDWDAAEDTTAVSRYMEVLTKETGTLYRVLLKNLPASTVSEIMKPVFDNYRQQWTEAFSSRTIDTETGRQRMLSDLASFKSRIDKIPESGDLSDHLISIVNAKSIAATANGPVPSHEEDGAAISTP
ncbi:hypothetical protein KEM52_000127 [Ascosphaera acerosa]|nr:hypothetical protein KEM52_000127 [Ascosphaera acerosa]